MARTVYHLLSETEPFSEFRGGAISRWTANVLKPELESIILCPSADDSWAFAPARVVAMHRFSRYEKVRKISTRLPHVLQKQLIKKVLLPVVNRIGNGDVLWVHNRPDYAAILAPYVHRSGGKVVLHLHNSHLSKQPIGRMRRAKIDHFVFGSAFLQREALSTYPEISSTILNYGADEEMFYPPAEERGSPEVPIVLFASRLVKEKGGHIFLEAMRRLGQAGIRAKGIMVGASHFGGSKTTPYITSLHNMAPPNVELRPYCSGMELATMFREADIFCAPVIWEEPFGMVNVEAFASALPIVGTHGGGSREVFADGGGLLVERGSTGQLVDALKQLIANPEARKRLADEGRRSFKKNFTWQIIQGRYRNTVSSISQ